MKIGDKVRVPCVAPKTSSYSGNAASFRRAEYGVVMARSSHGWVLVQIVSRANGGKRLYREAFWPEELRRMK